MKRRGEEGIFPRDALIRRVAEEPAVLFGAGRALLLQVAHPSVAAGVAQFSNFQTNPFSRLIGTMEATYAVVFGDKATSVGIGQRIQWIHEKVAGMGYRANDPENLLWVHATLFDTMRLYYSSFIQPLTADEQETLYEEMAVVATLFGLPRTHQPENCAAFDAYFHQMVASMEITETACELAAEIVAPGLPFLPRPARATLSPALSLFRLWAIGTTPEPIRSSLGFEWTKSDEERLHRSDKKVRAVFRHTPRPLRITPGWLQGRYLLRRANTNVASFNNRKTP